MAKLDLYYGGDQVRKLDEREENFIRIIPQEKCRKNLVSDNDMILDCSSFLHHEEKSDGTTKIFVNWGEFAEYETVEQAKEVIDAIGSAVNRGDKIFVLPEQEYFYQLESLFNAQRILKNYLSEFQKSAGVWRVILKDRISFEHQRIKEIINALNCVNFKRSEQKCQEQF